MSTVIDSLEQRDLKRHPQFEAGDRVRVHFQVVEGNRRRTQVFEGIVLKRQGSGARETFTVRKHSFGVGVERTFPLHSPKIEKLEVAARGDVRRAKLYYLREKVGKSARVAERRWGIEEDFIAPEEPEAVDSEGVPAAEAEPEVVGGEQEEAQRPEEGEAVADAQRQEDSEQQGDDEQQRDIDQQQADGEAPAAEQREDEAEAPAPEPEATEESDRGAEAASSDEAKD